jgi:hypothetical protein
MRHLATASSLRHRPAGVNLVAADDESRRGGVTLMPRMEAAGIELTGPDLLRRGDGRPASEPRAPLVGRPCGDRSLQLPRPRQFLQERAGPPRCLADPDAGPEPQGRQDVEGMAGQACERQRTGGVRLGTRSVLPSEPDPPPQDSHLALHLVRRAMLDGRDSRRRCSAQRPTPRSSTGGRLARRETGVPAPASRTAAETPMAPCRIVA